MEEKADVRNAIRGAMVDMVAAQVGELVDGTNAQSVLVVRSQTIADVIEDRGDLLPEQEQRKLLDEATSIVADECSQCVDILREVRP